MNKIKTALAICAFAAIAAPAAAYTVSFEEQGARTEEARVIAQPIAGIENKLWFNYQADLLEARKELRSDLRRASDSEDQRDAWDEYRIELSGARRTYVKKMRKRGYRHSIVTVG